MRPGAFAAMTLVGFVAPTLARRASYRAGACDDSGDAAAADVEREFSEPELEALASEMAKEGWSVDPDPSGRKGAWTLEQDGRTFSAAVYNDGGFAGFEIRLD